MRLSQGKAREARERERERKRERSLLGAGDF